MKKKFMGMALVLTSALLASNVYAATVSDLEKWQGDKVDVTKTPEGNYTLKLTDNAQQDIEIQSGEIVTIDLNDHKLENFVDSGKQAGSATIWVQSGAKVTITGNGTIGQQSNTGNVSVIANEGELIIEEGVTITDGRNSTADPLAPVIGNSGNLVINGGTISTTLQNSAAIYNYGDGKMTINNVSITNNIDKTSGITNDGIAVINNGQFIQGNGYSVILNRGNFTINGGTFKTTDEKDLGEASLITNEKNGDKTPVLKIKNGSFNSDVLFIGNDVDESTIEITGGSFSNSEEIKKYLGSGYKISNGKVVKKTNTVVSNEESKNEEVVSVEGSNASVSVTTLTESNTTYKTMLEKVAEKGYKTVFGAYELTTVSNIGEQGITLVFKVGTANNGKAAYVLHQKHDGSYEEFNEVVSNGVVKITVKELSPFMIALGEVVKDDAPETSDVFPMALIGMMTLGLFGTLTYRKLHN